MISNKTLVTLFLIALNMELATSTIPSDTLGGQTYPMNLPLERQERASKPEENVFQSTNNTVNDAEVQRENTESPSDVRGSSPSVKPAPSIRKRIPISKPKKNVLQDTTSTEEEIQPVRKGVEEVVQVPEQAISPVNNRFEELIEKGEYGKIFEIGEKMNNEEFLRQLCPVVKTLDQYNRIVDYLERHNLVASFYMHGSIEVIKEVVALSKVYNAKNYDVYGDLEAALPLALEKDCHDRFIELLNVRKEITAKTDEQLKLKGWATSFWNFVFEFLQHLVPWENGMALKRFLTLRGDELRNKYRYILDILFEYLMRLLRENLHLPKAERLLVDLIGQPLLLTPVEFARAFLRLSTDTRRSNFIKHGWREAIQEGLKTEYRGGGEELWRAIQAVRPDQFSGRFPDTEEARAAACICFPTKQEKEVQWADENAKILYNKLKHHESISYLFPDVLLFIISNYAVSWTDTDPIISKE